MDADGLRKPLLGGAGAGRSQSSAEDAFFSPGSPASSIVLLFASTIGTGVIALPYSVSLVGVPVAVLIFAVAALAGFTSNVILFRCSFATGFGSYGELVRAILGRGGSEMLNALVCVECLVAIATYLVFLGDYVPQVCALFGDEAWCTDKDTVIWSAAALIWPLSCMRGLSALRYVSTFSVAAILFTALVVVGKVPGYITASAKPLNAALLEVRLGGNSFLRVLSMCTFAYMVHTTSPEVARQFRVTQRRRVTQVLAFYTVSIWLVYVMIAVCGYLSFLDEVHPDFLTNYEIRDGLVVACRVMLSMTLVFACPLNMFPAMQALFNLLEFCRWKAGAATKNQRPLYDVGAVRIPVTSACFAVVLRTALRSPNVADLVSGIGAFLTSPLMFGFPALMYWRILDGRSFVVPITLITITCVMWVNELVAVFGGGDASE